MNAIWLAIKQYVWVGAFMVAMGFGAYVAHQTTKARAERAEQAAATLSAEVKSLKTASAARDAADRVRDTNRTLVAQRTKENNAKLETALGASPEWRDEPVPAAVADSLRDAARRANSSAPAR